MLELLCPARSNSHPVTQVNFHACTAGRAPRRQVTSTDARRCRYPREALPCSITGCSVRTERALGVKAIFAVLIVCAIGAYAYSEQRRAGQRATRMESQARTAIATGEVFRCDGRIYRSQMTSCAEAKYFLDHCPGTRMDGNNDGVPCEKQWCK